MNRAAMTGESSAAHRTARSAGSDPAACVRILSYNVRHCRGAASPIISEARTARVIRSFDPDIAGLNEVYRWVLHDQPARLSDMTGMKGLFDKARPVRAGEYGNLLLSRFPVREIARVPLKGRIEPRTCLIVEVDLPFGSMAVALTHLGLGRGERRDQLAAILDAVPREGPLVLLGDFNAQPSEFEPLLAGFQTAPVPPLTFPSVKPLVALDHVLFSHHFTFGRAWAPPSLASDHRPLVTELLLRDTAHLPDSLR